jgi:ATP-binding cassette subfamily B protein
MIIALAGVLFEVIKPLPVKLVIDYVVSDMPPPEWVMKFIDASSPGLFKYKLLTHAILVMIIVAICSFITSLLVFNTTVRLAQRLVTDLMLDFFSKLQRLSLSFYSRNKTGDLLQRITSDVFVAYFLVAQILLPAITSLVGLAIMFYIMINIDFVLAMIAISIIPMIIVVLVLFTKPMDRTTTLQYQTQGLFSAFLQQSLSSMKIIQAFGREKFMDEKLKLYANEFSSAYIRANKVSMTFNQSIALITGLASAIILAVGARRGINGLISAGDLFVFLGYLVGLYGPVNALATAVGGLITISARGKRVFDILDSKEVVNDNDNSIKTFESKGNIEFCNVDFGYTSPEGVRNKILHNLSFKVSSGQIIAIVGPTGTGKTSLISLIARFYDPWKGKILIDGKNINDISLKALRDNISIVLQDPFIFPMTIAENIAFGNPDASMEEIINAAKAAQAHDFISKLERGYDTKITEMGNSLSGGEKQRISIARAFLKNAAILIMDEPTSAVDAITESKIFSEINKYAVGRTVFLISHRLSAIKHADQIITIKDGYLEEQGTHDALMLKGKLYADLYKYQHIS